MNLIVLIMSLEICDIQEEDLNNSVALTSFRYQTSPLPAFSGCFEYIRCSQRKLVITRSSCALDEATERKSDNNMHPETNANRKKSPLCARRFVNGVFFFLSFTNNFFNSSLSENFTSKR